MVSRNQAYTPLNNGTWCGYRMVLRKVVVELLVVGNECWHVAAVPRLHMMCDMHACELVLVVHKAILSCKVTLNFTEIVLTQ